MSKGCIYIETSSRGKHSPKTPRFVAEITINGHRHRFRSTQLYPVQCWLEQKQREAGQPQEKENKCDTPPTIPSV